MNRRTRDILLWALLPVALVGIGILNYFAGGVTGPEDAEQTPSRLEFGSADLERTYGSATLLELGWGAGPSGVARADDAAGEPMSTLEAVIAEDSGGFLLVDHPPAHLGARVRRYGPKGQVLDTMLTPAGSTLFASVDGGVAYVLAKQSGSSERLVVRDGSQERTYVVPLSLNSGSILQLGGDIWVTAVRTAFDSDTQQVTATEIAVPVTIDGRQATDEEATEAVREGWYAVGDSLFEREQVVVGHGETAQVTQTVRRESDGAVLEVPGRSTPMGVDEGDSVFVLVPPEELGSEIRRLPATYGSRSSAEEVLVGSFDGNVVGRIVVPGDVPTIGGWSRMDVTPTGAVLAAVSDTRGVRILRYEAVDTDE